MNSETLSMEMPRPVSSPPMSLWELSTPTPTPHPRPAASRFQNRGVFWCCHDLDLAVFPVQNVLPSLVHHAGIPYIFQVIFK